MKKARMIHKIKWNYNNKGPNYQVDMTVDLQRFEKNYSKAQFELDSTVMRDMIPYMPMVTGTFINVTKAMSAALAGSGQVVAAAPPYGRFLYNGKVMVDEQTGSPFARLGARKIVTNKQLNFFTGKHPKVKDHWFDAAKDEHAAEWIKKAKQTAGGG